MNQFKHILTHRIEPYASRKLVNRAVFEELKQSIQQQGLINPIVVWQKRRKGIFWFLKPRYYWAIDGVHRLLAAQELGMLEVPCQIIHIEEREVFKYMVHANKVYTT